MKNQAIACILLFTAQVATAQWFGSKTIKGNGNLITKTFNTGSYDSVHVTGSMDVELVAGKEGGIQATAESNIMDFLLMEVKGSKLLIRMKDHTNTNTTKGITIKVPVEKISGASVSGSGEITSDLLIKSAFMELKVSGSGEIDLYVETARLKTSVTGSGDLEVRGRTENLDASVTGSGDLKAYGLRANNVDASVTGSGDIGVYCNGGNLKARVTGSGDIRYKGNASKVDKNVIGSGDITKM